MLRIFLLVFFLLQCVNTFSQNVPENIQKQFQSSYANDKNATWTKENSVFKVTSVTPDDLSRTTFYSADGTVNKKITVVYAKDLPTVITNYFEEKYPGDKNYTVTVTENNSGEKFYQSSKNDEMILVDQNGNIIDKASAVKP